MKFGLVFLLISLAGCSTTISGLVVDRTGQPIEETLGRVNIVKLDGTKERPAQETVAIDSDGTFHSNAEIVPGRYLVEAMVPGYRIHSVRLEVDKSRHLKILLQKIPSVRTQSIGSNQDVGVGRGAGAASIHPPGF